MELMDYAVPVAQESEPTMSHIQIAEVVQSRPDSVKRTMERLADRGVISYTPMVEMIEVGKGARRQMTTYHVNERDSYVVIAQLCPEYTAKLVDFWLHYRDKPKPQHQIPQSYSEALLLAANLQKKIEEDQPKVDYAETVMETDGAMSLTATAKSSPLCRSWSIG